MSADIVWCAASMILVLFVIGCSLMIYYGWKLMTSDMNGKDDFLIGKQDEDEKK